ncbi:MAG: 7-cyano-7-deazaguanine synthase [Acidobacteriota bacterium]
MTRDTALVRVANVTTGDRVIVLAGGGIETAALIPALLGAGAVVTPLRVRCGFGWERHESAALRRCCARLARPNLQPIVEVEYGLADVLASHWGITGRGIPTSTDDPALLEIPLRNITLLTAAATHFRDAPELVMATGTTSDNHFGDGSRAFFDASETLLSMATQMRVRVLTPFIEMSKTQVIQQADLAVLAASWSCIDPDGDQQCGRCIKCGRRRAAFLTAGVIDPTRYAAGDDLQGGP